MFLHFYTTISSIEAKSFTILALEVYAINNMHVLSHTPCIFSSVAEIKSPTRISNLFLWLVRRIDLVCPMKFAQITVSMMFSFFIYA